MVTRVSDVRILAQTSAGDTVLVAVEGDELPVGGFDPALYQPVRIFDVRHGTLSEPLAAETSRRSHVHE